MNFAQSSTVNGPRKVGTYRHGPSESEQRSQWLEWSVQLLIARTESGDFSADGLRETGKLLEAVPLTTVEFNSSKRHLQNASAYGRHNEYGAAAFELRIVRGILQRL